MALYKFRILVIIIISGLLSYKLALMVDATWNYPTWCFDCRYIIIFRKKTEDPTGVWTSVNRTLGTCAFLKLPKMTVKAMATITNGIFSRKILSSSRFRSADRKFLMRQMGKGIGWKNTWREAALEKIGEKWAENHGNDWRIGGRKKRSMRWRYVG